MLQGAWRKAERAEWKTEREDEEVLGEIAGWLQENCGSFAFETLLQMFYFLRLRTFKETDSVALLSWFFFRVGKSSCPDVCLLPRESKSATWTAPPLKMRCMSTSLALRTQTDLLYSRLILDLSKVILSFDQASAFMGVSLFVWKTKNVKMQNRWIKFIFCKNVSKRWVGNVCIYC